MLLDMELSGVSVLCTEGWVWLARGWQGQRASMVTEFKGQN